MSSEKKLKRIFLKEVRAIKRISSFLLIAVTETYEFADIIKLNER